MMLTEGQLVKDKYLIQGEIASGSLRPAYRALDTESGELMLLTPVALTSEEAEGLRSDLERIRSLEHPNIAPPGEMEMTEQGEAFLAARFVEGRTLEEVIRNEAPLMLSRACTLARQMGMALEAAHHAGVIHGDLTPSNVTLVRDEEEETAIICGLGMYPIEQRLFVNLAHLAVSADGQSLFGAPEYISPEQAVGTSAEALDGRSDLYSLGVILYRMLTGELPLQGANAMEMLLAQIFSEPCPFSETAGRETPVAVETLVMRTLAKRREDRPPSATALIDQLAAWEDRKAPTRRLAVVPLAQAKPEALHSTAVPPPEPEPPAPRVTPVTAPAMAATPELPEIPVFEMRASDTSAPSLELQPHKEDVALDLDPGESSAAPVEAAPDAVAELEFSPERSREPSPVSSTLPHDDFSADLRESSEAAFSISLPGEAAAERADPGEESERAEWTSQVAEEHDDSAPPFAAHSAQAHTGGFDIQFGLPEIPKPDSATMERAQDTEPVRAMPPVLPVAVHAAASGPVLFANYSPRPKRRRRWPKALAIAAIVILILIGAGCGFLYYTGRSYWLNPDYVRMRVSSFLNGGTTSSSPQVETDAYSQSNPLSTAPNSAPPGVSTAVPSASAGSSKPGASPVGGAAPSRSTEQPEQHQGMQQSANANNPGLAASTAATPTAAEPSPNLARPSGTPETARVPQKQVRRAPRAVENTAGLVAAAITRGDYYFNRGDYDAAIRAYQDGLTHSPSNAQLTAEIARARKAKAAEAKYLQ